MNLEREKSQDAQCACRWEKKAEPRPIRQQITGGSPPILKKFRTKWMEKKISLKVPSKVEHEMLTSMKGEKAKGKSQAKNRNCTPKDHSQQG